MMRRDTDLRFATFTMVLAALAIAGVAPLASRGAELPFSSTYRRPAVSPYMQLQQQGYNPLQQQNIYQTMVQPQVQQQQQQIEQLNQRRQMGQLQNQVRQIQQSPQNRQFDETIRPTGHASTFMNYSHFYPPRR